MSFETKRYLKKKNRNVIAYGNELAKGAANKAADQTAAAVDHVGNTNQNALEKLKFKVELQAKYNRGEITDATLFSSFKELGLSKKEALIAMQNSGALGNVKGKAKEYDVLEKMDDNVPVPNKVAARRNKEYQAEREKESQQGEWREERRSESEPASFPKTKVSRKEPPGAFLSISESIVHGKTRNTANSSAVTDDVVDHSSMAGDVVHGSLYKKAEFSQGVEPTKVFDYAYIQSPRGGTRGFNGLLLIFLGGLGLAFVLSLYQHTKIKAALTVAKDFNDDKITFDQAEFLLLNQLKFSPEKTRAFLLGKDKT